MKYLATILLLIVSQPALAQAPVEIGSWRLACVQDKMTDRGACVLRLKDWVDPPAAGAPGLALEVLDRRGRLVPAITARDLTLEGAGRGLLALTGTAQLRFPPNKLFEMPCSLEGRSLVCAPKPEDVERAEKELLGADRALARIVGATGASSTTDPTELKLSGTRDAIARLAKEAPPGAVGAEPPGLDAREILQKLMRALSN
jgi:hypothetical protein